MEKLFLEQGYTSLNKKGEELCGDKVECISDGAHTTLVLADGLGSGVKANILATLTSKILCTMVSNEMSMDECVETVVQTLPVCKVRGVAYATFSVVHLGEDGKGWLFEFDNPEAILIRDGKCLDFERVERDILGKKVYGTRLELKPDDYIVLMSDGVIHAGIGMLLNFGWLRKDVKEYLDKNFKKGMSARGVACLLAGACNDLYMGKPGDDTTVCTVKIRKRKSVNLMLGPPRDPKDVNKMMSLFFAKEGKHIVCGGTTSTLAGEFLGKPVTTLLDYVDPEIPPIAKIEGVDLVTEGVITLSRVLEQAKSYQQEDDIYADWNVKEDGASLISRMLFEEATDINFFVGRAINPAHQNPDLPITFNIKMHLVEELSELLRQMGKRVKVSYF